eukprot:TRINITY_DN7645_c0_g1_i4.p1 TRINITY_DN7645_c0_g1~~TRINITY_DN7645_c0_g1_i4.p1  ORF type:complete len:412 (-),score=84.93 TRINITY_DN7645_c0_g1_i4:53-1288(-)
MVCQMKSKARDVSAEFKDSRNYQDEEFKIAAEENAPMSTPEDYIVEPVGDNKLHSSSKAKPSSIIKNKILVEENAGRNWDEVNVVWRKAIAKFGVEVKSIKEGIVSELHTLKNAQGRMGKQVISRVREMLKTYKKSIKDCQHNMRTLKKQYDALLEDNEKLVQLASAYKSDAMTKDTTLSPRVITEGMEEVPNTLKELQTKLIHIKETLIHRIQSVSTQLERSRNEILAKVKSQLLSADDLELLTSPKEPHSISSLNENSTEVHYLAEDLHRNENCTKTPQRPVRRYDPEFSQRVCTVKAGAGSLTGKKSREVSPYSVGSNVEEEKVSRKLFDEGKELVGALEQKDVTEKIKEDKKTENSTEKIEDDIENLINPALILDERQSSSYCDEEGVTLSVNAICVDRNEHFIVVP